MICKYCQGTGSGGHIRGCPIVCEVCKGSGKVVSPELEKDQEIERLQEEVARLRASNNEHLTRRIDLECAIKWWCNDKMKDFEEKQYGKGQMRTMIAEGKCWDFSKEEAV